jgi:hypothetical protein
MTRRICAKSALAMMSLGLALYCSTTTRAEDPNAILDLLERKGLITSEEAAQARKYYEKQQAEAVVKDDKTKVASWINEMKWYGDLRLRSDYFSFEKDLDKADRLRWRYRLRLGTEMKVQDWADINARLISGEASPGSQLSGNATETSTFTKKPINIDLAFVRLHPPFLEGVQVIGGKFEPVIWSPTLISPMIYDPDVTVEGIGEQLNYKFGDNHQFRVFGNAGQYAVHEFSTINHDAYMYDSQAGFQAKLDPVVVTIAGGYYLTQNLPASDSKGATTLGDSANLGNGTMTSIVKGKTNTVYIADFGVVYGEAEVAWTICKDPFLGTPSVMKVGGMYLKNLSDRWKDDPRGDATDGWTVQATFGDSAKKGQWMLAYQYKKLEANATLDAITDDDFGPGGTDRKGHVVRASYNVKDWWVLGATAYVTEKISSLSDRPNSGHNQVGIPGQDNLHFYADTMFKF